MQNLENLVKQCGVELYDSEVVSENSKSIYRIYITKQGGVSLDLCEAVSRLLSPIFDVEPPIKGEYVLEVSSPGLERKLDKPKHFAFSVGELVKITALINNENTKIYGKLVQADENFIVVENEKEKFEIKLSDIKKARTYFKW
ncbi:MAG: ribosome maturation factor RimP [Campylobacter sp.]